MSRDNAVLIMRMKHRAKLLWVVLHVQAHELFGNPQWTRWWLWAHPLQQYTTRRSMALDIAQHMASGIDQLEHGIIEFFNRVSIDDAILQKGEIVFVDENIRPATSEDQSSEQDWRKIDLKMPDNQDVADMQQFLGRFRKQPQNNTLATGVPGSDSAPSVTAPAPKVPAPKVPAPKVPAPKAPAPKAPARKITSGMPPGVSMRSAYTKTSGPRIRKNPKKDSNPQ